MNYLGRFVIVGAGSLEPGDLLFERTENDFICAADAGYAYLKEAGIRPDLVVGDFDSSDEPQGDFEIIRLPVVKDDTDIVYCVREGFRRGFLHFLILGALGGERLSHTVANLQLLSMIRKKGGDAVLRFGNITAFVLGRTERVHFDASLKGSLSLFSLSESAVVTLENLFYVLEEGELTRTFPLGVSNHFTGKPAAVDVHRGEVLVILEKEDE
ncbi:MAG: thiamine diphosphokinase [Lachnospiraceae bacterium]|nr:thiamine diphosphokinase [Lachnospiraceae bacterium]